MAAKPSIRWFGILSTKQIISKNHHEIPSVPNNRFPNFYRYDLSGRKKFHPRKKRTNYPEIINQNCSLGRNAAHRSLSQCHHRPGEHHWLTRQHQRRDPGRFHTDIFDYF